MAERSTRLTHHPLTQDGAQASGRDSETMLDLVRRLTAELSTLFRQEVVLAGAEVSRSLAALFLSLASVASGGAVLYAGFLFLLFTAVVGLTYVVPLWLASLAVGLAVTLIGCVLVLVGRHKLRSADLLPRHSPHSLRRDKNVLTRSGS
jgi:hypothetical protein